MISFKEFLAENVVKKWDVKQTDLKQLIKLMNAQYKDGLRAISNGSILYRGFSMGKAEASGYKIIDTKGAARTSRDTNNLYQLCMDHSTALADYPKRSNSLICATRFDIADNYGTVNVLIPIDGTKVAVASNPDLFDTRIKSPVYADNGVESFGIEAAQGLSELEIGISDDDTFTDMAKLDRLLTNINPSKIANAFSISDFYEGPLLKLLSRCPDDKKMTAIASTVLTPKSLGLKLIPFGDVLPTNGKGHGNVGNEAWFSGKAVAIDIRTFVAILIELEKLGHPIHATIMKDLGFYMKRAKDGKAF